MHYNERKENSNIKGKLLIFIFFTIVIFIASFNFLKSNILTGIQGNIFYNEMLKYSIPLIGANEDDGFTGHNYEIKKSIMNLLGINIYNPLSILEKELPLVALNNGSVGDTVSLNPFKLSDSSVSQGEDKGTLENNQGDKNTEASSENKDLKKSLDKSKPEVLIYHTHNNEEFAPGGAANSIATAGAELARVLEEIYGISVIHDKTIHIKNYSTSYKSSAKTLDNYLNQYKDFKLIIDLHRDGGPSKSTITTNINGENVAKIMFVISKDRKNINENMKLVNEMIETSNRLYPGFSRGIRPYDRGKNNFNQDKSSKAVLIELGSEVSTIDEAKASAKYIGRIIAETINKK
ncbi:stage II sporulation protein P [Clostridium sp.]|uniref:stage II sporulation protein P n=1 Tax=Clostridium sp. TaxID=1506 RepID=UPI003464B0EA